MTNLAPQTMYQPKKRGMTAPFKEWSNINDIRAKIINELNYIPNEELLELYHFILYFRLGAEQWHSQKSFSADRPSQELDRAKKLADFMALEGILADDNDFDMAMEYLNQAWESWNIENLTSV